MAAEERTGDHTVLPWRQRNEEESIHSVTMTTEDKRGEVKRSEVMKKPGRNGKSKVV